MRRLTALLFTLSLALVPAIAFAQGDGPRVHTPAPVGIHVPSLTWMDVASNQNFADDILIPGGGLEGTIWALNYNHMFALGDRFAELWVTGIGGDLDGFVVDDNGRRVDTTDSGISDPYVALRVGLFGAPALSPADFVAHRYGFSLYGLIGLTLPWGDYRQSSPLNLGTNRWSLRLGTPMTWDFGGDRRTWLELHPSIYLYGDNDEPFRAEQREQDPLLAVESHLSHNFTAKFWASLDLRYRYGGETTTDGVDDDNRINQWGGGFSLGYQFTSALSGFFGYGEIFAERDGSDSEMWRARLIYAF